MEEKLADRQTTCRRCHRVMLVQVYAHTEHVPQQTCRDCLDKRMRRRKREARCVETVATLMVVGSVMVWMWGQ